jgi:type IV pilus biogenesis protein CpaD/CtpE
MWCRMLIAGFCVLLSGCGPEVYRQSGTPIPGFGNAVQQNNAVMIDDPEPASAANTVIDMDGRRAWIAIERYRSGEVIEPLEPATTEFVPVVIGDGEGTGDGME